MMDEARITAIIPTHRRPALLQRAVASVLDQRGVQTLVAIFDNASADETETVVEQMASAHPNVRYHCHAENIGAVANFEFGLRSVETSFFSILSDDDYLLPGFYERAIRDLENHPHAIFWAGITLNVDQENTIWDARVAGWSREGIFDPPDGLMRSMRGMAPTWTGIVFRREVFDSVGLPDRSALGPADLDFILRIAAKHSFLLYRIPVAVFSLNPTSFSATQPLSSFWPGWKKILDNVRRNTSLDSASIEKVWIVLDADAKRMLFRRGVNALSNGRLDFARDAANALDEHCGRNASAVLLRCTAAILQRSQTAQRLCSAVYRFAERRLVRSRRRLQTAYGHLLRHGPL